MSGEKKTPTFQDSGQAVALQRVSARAMFLRQEVASGDAEGREFKVTLTTNGFLLVEFDSPRSVYGVGTEALVEAALKAEGKP